MTPLLLHIHTSVLIPCTFQEKKTGKICMQSGELYFTQNTKSCRYRKNAAALRLIPEYAEMSNNHRCLIISILQDELIVKIG